MMGDFSPIDCRLTSETPVTMSVLPNSSEFLRMYCETGIAWLRSPSWPRSRARFQNSSGSFVLGGESKRILTFSSG